MTQEKFTYFADRGFVRTLRTLLGYATDLVTVIIIHA